MKPMSEVAKYHIFVISYGLNIYVVSMATIFTNGGNMHVDRKKLMINLAY